MFDKEILNEIIDKIEKRENQERTPKNLVQVKFEDGFKLVYFSDLEQISVGDVVSVEGKMENKIGVVSKVLNSFKKPKFDMKWIEKRVDNDISGDYFKIEDEVVSLDTSFTVDKFMNIYAGVKYEENIAVGEDNVYIDLADLEESEVFEDEDVKERGRVLYKKGYVPYIYLKDGVGKAVVRSANGYEWYEIDFRYQNGKVTYLACDCPYFGECKHLYAFLLKLRDFTKKLFKTRRTENFVMCKKECFNYIMLYGRGKVTIEL